MNDMFRENILKTLFLIGGFSSIVNIPILYNISFIFAAMVFVFSLGYLYLYYQIKNELLSYDQASRIGLFILMIQTLNIPLHAGVDTFFLPWVLIYPMVIFTLKDSAYSLKYSILLFIIFAVMFLSGSLDESYTLYNLLPFMVLYATFIVVFYSINKNLANKEIQLREQYKQLQEMNASLSKNIKKATYDLELKNINLQESNENFQNVLDTTMEMIVLFGEDKIIQDVNQSGVLMLGYERKSEVIGRNIVEFILPSDLEKVQNSLKKENTEPYELTILNKNNEEVHMLNRARNIIIDNKKVRMSTLLDLSEIKRKDKLLQEQSRLAQMGEMISMIAHQWRQPLGAISSSVISIQTKKVSGKYDLTQNQQREDYFKFSDTRLENINEYVQILSSTIDDFRNFFKSDKKRENVNLTLPIKRALNIVQESLKAKNIKIVTEFNVDEKVCIYQNEMMQVILNILKNAEDSLVEKSTKGSQIVIQTKEVDNQYLISIHDNGMGISDTILLNIFDPYFSTKDNKNGTGLGLYMSKIIVQEHNNGKLNALKMENGACFEIYLNKEINV